MKNRNWVLSGDGGSGLLLGGSGGTGGMSSGTVLSSGATGSEGAGLLDGILATSVADQLRTAL